jgi:hypothetical protein
MEPMDAGKRPGREVAPILIGLFALGATAAIPPIDTATHAQTKTATFALG